MINSELPHGELATLPKEVINGTEQEKIETLKERQAVVKEIVDFYCDEIDLALGEINKVRTNKLQSGRDKNNEIVRQWKELRSSIQQYESGDKDDYQEATNRLEWLLADVFSDLPNIISRTYLRNQGKDRLRLDKADADWQNSASEMIGYLEQLGAEFSETICAKLWTSFKNCAEARNVDNIVEEIKTGVLGLRVLIQAVESAGGVAYYPTLEQDAEYKIDLLATNPPTVNDPSKKCWFTFQLKSHKKSSPYLVHMPITHDSIREVEENRQYQMAADMRTVLTKSVEYSRNNNVRVISVWVDANGISRSKMISPDTGRVLVSMDDIRFLDPSGLIPRLEDDLVRGGMR